MNVAYCVERKTRKRASRRRLPSCASRKGHAIRGSLLWVVVKRLTLTS